MEKGHRLAVRYPETSFQELVEYYWSLTPEVSPDLAARYVRHSLAGVGRGRRLLSSLEREQPELATRPGRGGLELGCRGGGLLVAAGRGATSTCASSGSSSSSACLSGFRSEAGG